MEREYKTEAGSSPIRTTASLGLIPLCRIAATSALTSSLMAAATFFPSIIVAMLSSPFSGFLTASVCHDYIQKTLVQAHCQLISDFNAAGIVNHMFPIRGGTDAVAPG